MIFIRSGQNADSISQIKCYYKFKSVACNEWKRRAKKTASARNLIKIIEINDKEKKGEEQNVNFLCADFTVIESGELQITRLMQRSIGYHD